MITKKSLRTREWNFGKRKRETEKEKSNEPGERELGAEVPGVRGTPVFSSRLVS
jgi:hypothetical protein